MLILGEIDPSIPLDILMQYCITLYNKVMYYGNHVTYNVKCYPYMISCAPIYSGNEVVDKYMEINVWNTVLQSKTTIILDKMQQTILFHAKQFSHTDRIYDMNEVYRFGFNVYAGCD